VSDSDLKKADRLYRSFREAPPQRARKLNVDLPKAVAEIGVCEFIGYMTTHGGKVKYYIHEFAAGSRPKLYAGTRRGQLYLFGGRFKVTELGITDMDRSGRTVHAKRRYEVKPKT
jgi:hypothetical protein